MPADALLKVEHHVGPLTAALVEPLAVAVHAVDLTPMAEGCSVGVVGAGPIGLLCTLVAKLQHHCTVTVVDLLPERLELARRMGADQVLQSVDEVAAMSADVVFEAAGRARTLARAIDWVRPLGTVSVVAIYEDAVAVQPTDLVVKEAVLQGVSSYGRADLEAAVDLLQREAIDPTPVVSAVVPLAQGARALAALLDGHEAGKVLLTP
jgi:L-iditol 2-dehydrogenase